MANEKWEGIRDSIIESVRGRAKGLFEKSQKATAYLTERAGRLAKLAVDRELIPANAVDRDVRRAQIDSTMAVVVQSIDNEVGALQIEATDAMKAIFASSLRAVGEFLLGGLPKVLKLLGR